MLTESTTASRTLPAPTGGASPRASKNRHPDPLHVHIIASAPIQQAIRTLPKLAHDMLIDPNTLHWKQGTFLIDHEGRFRNEWRALSSLVGNRLAGNIVREWSQLPAHGPHASTIAPFVHALIDEAEKQNKLPIPAVQLREYVTITPSTPQR